MEWIEIVFYCFQVKRGIRYNVEWEIHLCTMDPEVNATSRNRTGLRLRALFTVVLCYSICPVAEIAFLLDQILGISSLVELERVNLDGTDVCLFENAILFQ